MNFNSRYNILLQIEILELTGRLELKTWYTILHSSFVNSDTYAVFVNNVNWKTEIFVAF